ISPGSDPHVFSTSCEWAGNANGAFAEHLYKFTVDLPHGDANCAIEVEDDSGFIGSYVVVGDRCEGIEFECEATGYYHQFSRSDNGVYTLVVENRNPFQGSASYTISSTCD